jgi:hypothetical protein
MEFLRTTTGSALLGLIGPAETRAKRGVLSVRVTESGALLRLCLSETPK